MLTITPPASAQKGKIYEITEKSLAEFKSKQEVPDDVIKKLRSIIYQEVTGDNYFLDSLRTTIGDSLTNRYKSLIFEYALKILKTKNLKVIKIEGRLALNETIKVEISNLKQWINQGNKASDFILYIDGKAFKGLARDLLDKNEMLQFDITFKEESTNKEVWRTLMRWKQMEEKFFSRDEVPVTVGIQNEAQIQSSATGTLVRVKKGWFYVFVTVTIIVFILFFRLVKKTAIIRVSGPAPADTSKKRPYSLARTQMAFWFFIVVISYVFIWMVTDDLTNLTPTVLGLIGISAATGLGAVAVDSKKRSDQQNQRRILEKEKGDVEQEIAGLEKKIDTSTGQALIDIQAKLAAKKTQLLQTDGRLEEFPDLSKPNVSKGFIDDILADDVGVSFHRFQIFVWTIVLIIIFITSVINKITMPDFDETLLILMGISSGTYIGFKMPEQKR